MMDNKAIAELIAGFEDGTYPASDWTHESHIYMAVWYLLKLPLEEATDRIKEGIRQYNVSQGGENTATSGYHETITVFYIHVLHQFLVSRGHWEDTEIWAALPEQSFMSSDFPFRYYSKEHLMSKTARARWVEPDLKPLEASAN